MIILLTGQPSSGKTTIARGIIRKFWEKDLSIFLNLDGDELRAIYKDEGYGIADRVHNVSRAFDLAKYFDYFGTNVILSLVMPFKWQRDGFKDKAKVVEIYVSYSPAIQPRGRESYHVSYYEPPIGENHLHLDTTNLSEEEAIQKAFEYIEKSYQKE